MAPRKKDKILVPDTVVTPAKDECDSCADKSESSCESCLKYDDTNTTC